MTGTTDFASRCRPFETNCDGHAIHQYRGIKYGSLSRRFADPEAISYESYADKLDCTRFGPICPQVSTDFHHLLRVPEEVKSLEPKIDQDEFECLNLAITVPAGSRKGLPVMIWIHGGSQVMTFIPASSPCADNIPFVANSMKQEQPMIVVYVNYRLNIFAFGDGKGSHNLALKDQRLAIDWTVKHIESFGGDPNNITLAGESAGAVHVHAHMLTGAPIQRAILQSGSLHLSPPQDPIRGEGIYKTLGNILEKDGLTLASAPVKTLLGALAESKVVSMWLQLTEELSGWETRISHIDQLLIGDVEYESIIWRNGIETMTTAEIVACFDSAGDQALQLKSLYNIDADRPTSCKFGALDFINDTRFTLPVILIRDAYRKAGKSVYHYTFDQANPWQASSRAHHAVDLLMLFGNLNLNAAAAAVRQEVQDKWLSFCNGQAPWSEDGVYAFGPYGRCNLITPEEYESRRRVRPCAFLKQIGSGQYNPIFGKLAAGRISLLN
ncbi:Lipase [Lachnellula willkommii]|uniref:Carboxylic ester hydrolase n=1 Tax=Lachnellula willkommii TaxID=215461 RepID=A0A559LYS7_9HELO|nr:Lipase [Lachnellula willkommii]